MIRGATVVDGTGGAARTADVAVADGVIVDVGRVDGSATAARTSASCATRAGPPTCSRTARATGPDLPAGAGRLVQRSEGYVETIVAGETVVADGELTDARPGALVRGPRA